MRKTTLKPRYMEAFTEYWTQNTPDCYRALGLSAKAHSPPELKLPRQLLGHPLASRSGHGDFAMYHQRFNHKDALLKFLCDLDKEPEHFYYCRHVARRLRFWAPKPSSSRETIQWALGTANVAIAFAKWCNRTTFYRNISVCLPVEGTTASWERPGQNLVLSP